MVLRACANRILIDPAFHHSLLSTAVVSAKGYVVFYASSGSGYSVKAGQPEVRGTEFDSIRLGEGDLFALSLLEPTRYSVVNPETRANGEISVSFSPEDAKRIQSMETAYVEVQRATFNPAQIKLISTQGVVFRIHEKSRIVIEKLARAEPEEPPAHHWQKLNYKRA